MAYFPHTSPAGTNGSLDLINIQII